MWWWCCQCNFKAFRSFGADNSPLFFSIFFSFPSVLVRKLKTRFYISSQINIGFRHPAAHLQQPAFLSFYCPSQLRNTCWWWRCSINIMMANLTNTYNIFCDVKPLVTCKQTTAWVWCPCMFILPKGIYTSPHSKREVLFS